MLDELEGSSQRIFQQSRTLKNEATTQLRMLDQIDHGMERATNELRQEALNAESARKARSGVCWMYVVIIIEFISLVSLVIHGLE